jgi:hypothetical protein
LYVTPERETFLNFPSQILGDGYTLTVFLPQDSAAVPMQYPVVYYLGLDRAEKEKTQSYAKEHKILLVGINLKEKDYDRLGGKLYDFFSQELIPYIELNYAAQTEPSQRILAAKGERAAKAAAALFEREKRFGRLALLYPQGAWENLQVSSDRRVWVSGTQEELATVQAQLSSQGLLYGANFAFSYGTYQEDWVSELNVAYLLAPKQDVLLKKLQLKTGTTMIPLQSGTSVSLVSYAVLNNAMQGVYIPSFVRTSPPYLDWEAPLGMLRVRAGAESGTVQISVSDGKITATTKIVLKK